MPARPLDIPSTSWSCTRNRDPYLNQSTSYSKHQHLTTQNVARDQTYQSAQTARSQLSYARPQPSIPLFHPTFSPIQRFQEYHIPSNTNQLYMPRLQLPMRAIEHWLQRASTAERVRPCRFGLNPVGERRLVDGVLFGTRAFLRMRWLQAAFSVDGGGGHGFSKGRRIGYRNWRDSRRASKEKTKRGKKKSVPRNRPSLYIYTSPHLFHRSLCDSS